MRVELVREYLKALDLESGPPSLDLLVQLVRRHVATFAFGSVGPQLGEELPLDLASLMDRIVTRRRGGYCFEQNSLLFEVLAELGFAPSMYLGRVISDQGSLPGLTHRISTVELEGQRYVVDVGFGSQGPRVPVPMSTEASLDGNRTFRVAECRPGEFHLQILKEGEFCSLYLFEMARYGQADCEIGHFYSHRHPDATFVNHLVVSLILEHETRSLRNLEYWVLKDSGKQCTRIENAPQLRSVLLDQLGVQVSEAEAERLFVKLELAGARVGTT